LAFFIKNESERQLAKRIEGKFPEELTNFTAKHFVFLAQIYYQQGALDRTITQ